jgi:hypothetical protein
MLKAKLAATSAVILGYALLTAPHAMAASIISADGLFQLEEGSFGVGTGVHFTGSADDVLTADAIVNNDGSHVQISSSDTFDTNGSGEATVADGNGANADPYLDLTLDFAKTWGQLTFALTGTSGTTLSLNVNGIGTEFSYPTCSFCTFGSGENKFILTALTPGAQIDTVAFSFSGDGVDTGALTAKQFRVRDVAYGPGVPEPETWALMLIGIGGLGAVLRRQARTSARPA